MNPLSSQATVSFVEVQAGGEEATFTDDQFSTLVSLGKQGAEKLLAHQREALRDFSQTIPSDSAAY